jgi:two-component system, NtrC family, nitrogen regulation sensor histidine kinase NtrY
MRAVEPVSWWARVRAGRGLELAALLVVILVAGVTWWIIAHEQNSQTLLTPPLVALILVANLLATGTLIVLLGRRIAAGRAARSPTGGRGQLHERLVVIFSLLAAIPTILLAVIASLLFQYGAEFWFSGRAQSMIANSQNLAQASYRELLQYVDNENVAMAEDVRKMVFDKGWRIGGPDFHRIYMIDVGQRSLSKSMIFSLAKNNRIDVLDVAKADNDSFVDRIAPEDIERIRSGQAQSVPGTDTHRTYSLARIPTTNLFLYSTREGGAQAMAQRLTLARQVWQDYQSLRSRSRAIQLQFNLALLVISLMVIGIVVFVALRVADRLVRPIGELVGAAQRVAAGDLKARVAIPASDDEIAALSHAFNGMTDRLDEQRSALISANAQLDSRRALIEAVLSGVTAGVISVGSNGAVRLINDSARQLLGVGEDAVGQRLATIAPELARLLHGEAREAIVQVAIAGEARTLAVKIAHDNAGPILTFDDITDQLADQRRAAWSDVARRIAHEIKNPLTPIQLAAERLQRRYGRQVTNDDGTFARLTETIVRQVGDLRRMVDEFSSFARMPKPSFRDESLVDIARQALFLHEVAHPGIRFSLSHDGPIHLVCDRRQIGQALTNIVKNAVEAIEARGDGATGEIQINLVDAGSMATVEVLDNGVGLPVERDRIAEPYMTTRARGTGLGLAIVKKIVEEHFGTIAFADRPGGGTVVRIAFDTARLAAIEAAELAPAQPEAEQPLAALTRNRT